MNHDDSTPISDRERLAAAILAELRGLRTELQEMAARLTRVEKRVVHVYPKMAVKRTSAGGTSRASSVKKPSLTPEQGLALYDILVNKARSGDQAEVMTELQEMSLPDLKVLVTELGAPMTKRPARKTLVEAVAGRIRQSLLLTRHVNRPTPDPDGERREGNEGSNLG